MHDLSRIQYFHGNFYQRGKIAPAETVHEALLKVDGPQGYSKPSPGSESHGR